MRILIKNNKVIKDIQSSLKIVREFYARAGIKLDFVIENTDFPSVPFMDATVNGLKAKKIPDHWMVSEVLSPAKKAGFDGCIFLVNKIQWEGLPMEALRTDIISNFIDIQCGVLDGKYNFNGVFYEGDRLANLLIHELAHEFYLTNGLPDMTHYWFLSKKPEMIIQDLKPKNLIQRIIASIKPQNDRTAILVRKVDNGTQTTGKLVAINRNKVFECFTLELPWKNNQKNISRIPTGKYECAVGYSNKFKKILYQIKNVPNRLGILFHGGNYYTQIQGCILLGDSLTDINKDGQKDVTNSVKTVDKFMTFMENKSYTLYIQ